MCGRTGKSIALLAALAVSGLVACADDAGAPAQSNTALSNGGPAKMGVLLKVLTGRGKSLPGQLVTIRKGNVDVLIKASTATIPKLKQLGAQVRTVTSSGIMTASVPVNKIHAIAALSGVVRMEAAKRMRKYNDLSNAAPAGGCTHCVGMNNTGRDGTGVLVGVIDSGIDWTHGDFIDDSTGDSRIAYYWDQSDTADDKLPTGSGWSFTYGHEYNKAELTSALKTADNTWNTTTGYFGPVDDPAYPIKAAARDTDGHGTHVAGSAAGDGSGSGYKGGAPKADIIFVKFDFDGDRNSDAAIIDGIDYIFKRAAELGKPAVINMSLGSDFGPHDGTTLEEQGISDLTGKGKVVVVAAGNPGNNNWSQQLGWGFAMHGSGQMGTGGDAITFRFPNYTPGADNYVFFDVWTPGGNKCKVQVTTPGGQTYPPSGKRYRNVWTTGSAYTGYDTTEGGILVGNGGDQLSWGTNNNDDEIYIEISDYWSTNPAQGTWTIQFVPKDSKSTCTGTYHAWYGVSGNVVGGWKAEPTPRSPTPLFGGQQSNNAVTIGSPASADKVIAVAAYQSRQSWSYVWGTGTSCSTTPGTQSYGAAPITYYDPFALGELAYFSGRGPRRDGALKPEISAPGVGTASSLSHFVRDAEWDTRCVDYFSGGPYHYGLNRVLPGDEGTILQGTSMACPNATGGIANLMQAKNDLDHTCLVKIFTNSARKDTATETYENVANSAKTDTDNSATPNGDWGHGKLDVAAALTYMSTNGYATCTNTCSIDADCGAGGTCNVTSDPCGCGTCTQGPDCSADGTCNAACAQGADPDCAPDCSADGTCNAACAQGADPDCAPDCSADGTCNAACAQGVDPDCSCGSKGTSCTSNSDCCSNKCGGKPGNKACK